ncbi:hypothetical protein BHYA_0073g00190 [Botrytis hyacinthi]|uniref:NADP-dependent oxidoreductase domain-containing protein n=1 Tax=Botrytis hyacinthi TaxID=278943 RepID=A0A4Z1GTI3_9HELO|nr:hypothetical protein BHYA_0073g00190 [Botrytis hyacinthi]
MGHPSLIFGAASIGMDFSTKESVQDALEVLKELNISQIDTAGSTKILATKLGYGSGVFLSRLLRLNGIDMFYRKVDILYFHQPDPTTPLKEQAAALNDHFKKGSFKRLLRELIQFCEENGFVKPSVYQGDYNLITRGMEKELLPILRAHSMSFFAFRALAAGFLTGNYSAGKSDGTRFSDDHPLGKAFQNLYGAPKLQQAMKDLENILAPLGISGREASLRWIYYHSRLGDGDGIILGASKISQIRENVKSISAGPLSEEEVQKIEGIWDLLAEDRGGIL